MRRRRFFDRLESLSDILAAMRKFTVFVLVVAALWQGLATARQGLVGDYAEGFAHALMHWENEGHHHNDDGTFHADTSDESVRHVALDGSSPGGGLLPDTGRVLFSPLAAKARAPLRESALAPPFSKAPDDLHD
jgi:hypothetical protein